MPHRLNRCQASDLQPLRGQCQGWVSSRCRARGRLPHAQQLLDSCAVPPVLQRSPLARCADVLTSHCLRVQTLNLLGNQLIKLGMHLRAHDERFRTHCIEQCRVAGSLQACHLTKQKPLVLSSVIGTWHCALSQHMTVFVGTHQICRVLPEPAGRVGDLSAGAAQVEAAEGEGAAG